MKKYKYIFIILFALGLALAVFGFDLGAVSAQSAADNMLWGGQESNVQAATGLGNTDPRMIAANAIRILLGFLGVVAVVLILYGGWLWMSSQGDPQRIDKAKKVLVGAVIGLIIILMAFGIATFILNRLYDATTGAGSCEGGPPCAPPEVCCPGAGCQLPPCAVIVPGVDTFVISSDSPQGPDVILNARVRTIFNRTVDPLTVSMDPAPGATYHITGPAGPVAGTETVIGSRIEFVPDAPCPPNPCGATNCFDAFTDYTVTVDDGLTGVLSIGGVDLTCDLAHPCTFNFTTGDVVDCQTPNVNLETDMQVCLDTVNYLGFSASDDSGVAFVDYSDDNGGSAFIAPTLYPCPGPGPCGQLPAAWFVAAAAPGATQWQPTAPAYSAGTNYTITISGEDLDAHVDTDSRTFNLRAAHCCNGELDAAGDVDLLGGPPEEGVDCGGECALCSGAACGTDLTADCVDVPGVDCAANSDRCASLVCDCVNLGGTSCEDAGYDPLVDDCCLCQNAPVIQWLSPIGGFCDGAGGENTPCTVATEAADCAAFLGTCNTGTANGAGGNLATIGGRYFGAAPGVVEFYDGGGWIAAQLASAVNPNCTGTWSDRQIVVEVPFGLPMGNAVIRVTSAGGYEDTSGPDGRGPEIPFIINSIVRPGLCLLDPGHGLTDDVIQYHGIRLLNSTAYFGNVGSYVAANPAPPGFTTGDLQGQAAVPNMNAGRTTSFVFSPANVNSNFLEFVKDAEADLGPRITSFEPTAGAIGQYVTIFGAGFGGSRAGSHVYFGDEVSGIEADYEFPDVCADSVWSDNQVIVKVPGGIADGNYPITMVIGSWPPVNTDGLSPNVFTVDNSLPLAPSLCRIQPVMGPNNSPVSLWGEYFDAYANPDSRVRFHLNQDQFGPAAPDPMGPIISWGPSGDADLIDVMVHPAAVSGPVRVVKDSPEIVGNGLNFTIGLCTEAPDPDEACGPDICCPQGTFEEGRCRPAIDDCYSTFSSSVYEWDFDTGVGLSGLGDVCDGELLNPGCQASTTMCMAPLICDPATCTCQPESAESCSGLTLDQCLITEFCPNSPGQCSTYPGGSTQVVGSCDNTCDGTGPCTAATCVYSAALDRCVQTGSACDLNMPAFDILGNPVNAYCQNYGEPPTGRWHINTSLSCPPGWIQIFGGRCVDMSTTCNSCDAGYECVGGQCAAPQNICPADATCNAADECVNLDNPLCECCCEIGFDARDCCVPLECTGSCGSDPALGECSGCALLGGTQAEMDAACNCEGHIGKYCETTDPEYPEGVCRDCVRLSSSAECNLHNTSCCVDDAADGDPCRGGDGTLLAGGYCAYFDCNLPPAADTCNPAPATIGTFEDFGVCDAWCAANNATTTGLGLDCSYLLDFDNCNVAICGAPFECINEDGSGPVPAAVSGSFDTCGICCCDPSAAPDQCTTVSPELYCDPDHNPCGGPNRGICCGCETDLDCGSPDTIGCGYDGCCYARPSVVDTWPPDTTPDAGNICRNTLIRAVFNQPMDLGSFGGEMILAGDYGTDPCPDGTQYLASLPVKRDLTVRQRITNLLVRALGLFIDSPRLASAYTPPVFDRNYCAVGGSTVGYNDAGGNGVAEFTPSRVLDGDRLYYAMVLGDDDLLDTLSRGVENTWGITMNGPRNATFNARDYTNSYIWSFRTFPEQAPNNGICQLHHVVVNPYSYLFMTNVNSILENDANPADSSFDMYRDADKVFVATPYSIDDQILAPVPGYTWAWNWASSDPGTADIVLPSPFPPGQEYMNLVRTGATAVEGHTIVTATAQITADTVNVPTTLGALFAGNADVYVFICENPWPPIAADGTWAPWRDDTQGMSCLGGTGTCYNTNYEFYYCRDAGREGTYDDLPAILSDSTVIRGDINPEILKEAYFLREESPVGAVALAATDSATGGSVDLTWPAVAGVDGYRVYWGMSSNNYYGSEDVGNTTAYTLTGLNNNVTYYFNVTSYYATGAESEYMGEAEATPTDSTPPMIPMGLAATPGSRSVELEWTANTDETRGYIVYFGTASGVYGGSQDVGNNTSVVVDSLSEGTTFYFTVSAYDLYDNESPRAVEVSAVPLP